MVLDTWELTVGACWLPCEIDRKQDEERLLDDGTLM